MKISKSDLPAQTAATTDSITQQTTATPLDVFSNMILQMAAALQQPAQQLPVEQPEQNNATLTDVTDMSVQTMLQSANNANNTAQQAQNENDAILSQLDFLNNASLTKPASALAEVPATQEMPIKTDLPVKSPITNIQIDNKADNKIDNKTIKMTDMPAIPTATDINQLAAAQTENTLPDAMNRMVNKNNQPVTNNQDIAIQKNQKDIPKVPTIQSVASSLIADKPEEILQINAAKPAAVTAMLQTDDDQIKPTTAPAATRQMDTFAQLSHFINSHTLQMNTINSRAFTPALADAVQPNMNQTKTAELLQYEPKVEIVASSVGPFMQESYDAKIKLYPPDLGHVIAKLKVNKDNTQLTILTENAHVKSIVETNLPQLRQHFKDADINLTQIFVQSDLTDAKDSTGQNQRDSNEFSARESTATAEEQVLSPKSAPKDPNALVDTYAQKFKYFYQKSIGVMRTNEFI